MTTQSMACGSCAAAVPYGRLSCPSCGELLASVAGGRKVASGALTSTATPAVLYEIESAPRASVVDGDLALAPVARAEDTELPWGRDDASADDDLDDDDPDDDGDDDPLAPAARPIPAVLSAASEPTAAATWAVAGLAPATTLAPDAPAPRASAPGAYVPPPPAPMQVAGPAAPARAWAGHADPSGPSTPTKSGADGSAAAASAAAASAASRLDEFVRWLSVAGSALSAAGFLLPWSSVVIGSPGASYFDRWGMAGPWHVVVVLGVLAVLLLALVTNPIPAWVRVGLPGLGLGALLFGLVWPYLIGPLGAGPGVLMVVTGALLLGAAGITALAIDRHAGIDRTV